VVHYTWSRLHRRALFAGVGIVLVLVLAAASLYAVQAGVGAQHALKTVSTTGVAPLVRTGVLTSAMLNAPDAHAAAQPGAPYLTPLSADQRAAYERQVKQHPQAAPDPAAKLKPVTRSRQASWVAARFRCSCARRRG
jgi:hypothetical protein